MTEFKLYGIDKQVFEDFWEDTYYLERVTVADKREAHRLFCEEVGDWSLAQPDPIFMRYVTSEDEGEDGLPEVFEGEYEEGWLVCEEDHPDAVPFWQI